MFATRKKRKPTASPERSPRRHDRAALERDNARKRKISAAVRDIGPCGKPADSERRERCCRDFRLFCETYFPAIFYLPWSKDHLKAIAKIERAVLHGSLFALAMPRGSGKTALALVAAIWALVYGHRRFVCVIAATDGKAQGILKNIKANLNYNDLLATDFPEVCKPIRALEDNARRCNGQLCEGERTNITWTNDKVVLPTVKDSLASGSIVTVCGLTGSIRGQNHTLPTNEIIRPELVLVDDPQDYESANSDSQCEQRVAILSGDVLGMAGPGKSIAGIMPCTVIRAGDMADRILNRQLHPDWQGERCKMVYAFPIAAERWEQYAKIRAQSLQADGDGSEATDFYRENRQEMDEGAEVGWPERHNKDELSAIQHAVNLKLRDDAAFWSEYQNEPRGKRTDAPTLRAEQILRKTNGLKRAHLPLDADHVTAFIDVHDALLYYAVVGWNAESFAGYVADYGTWPRQSRRYFAMREADATLGKLTPGADKDAAITAGLRALMQYLFAQAWIREDNSSLTLDQVLIDVGYVPDTVYAFIRTSGKGSTVLGSKGIGIGASGRPMNEWRRQPGEIAGNNWIITKPANRELRHVKFDSNFWKTFVYERLALSSGARGTMTLYGAEIDAEDHRLLADHVLAEFGTPTEGRGRKVIEWRPKPAKPDNHFLDCLVGCAVAASRVGCGGPRRAVKQFTKPRNNVHYLSDHSGQQSNHVHYL